MRERSAAPTSVSPAIAAGIRSLLKFSTGSVSTRSGGRVCFVASSPGGSGSLPIPCRIFRSIVPDRAAPFSRNSIQQDALERVDDSHPERSLDRGIEMEITPEPWRERVFAGFEAGTNDSSALRRTCSRGVAGAGREENEDRYSPSTTAFRAASSPISRSPVSDQFSPPSRRRCSTPAEETVVEINQEDTDRRLAGRLRDVVLHQRPR
jgi:hypothetical protein